ncbi:MAG: glycosyltransferase family 4 protein [Candidatus Peregrinibacteria bacterium]|nr:glycosyltransferase family 4 protein [Candidatus Peregrinibacteria bacterium]
MRILFLTDDYPEEGGSSVAGVVHTLDQGLRHAGHDVSIITTHQTGEPIQRRDRVVSIPVSYRKSLRHYYCLHMPAVSRMLDEEIAKVKPDVIHAHNVHQHITYDGLRVARKHTEKLFLTLHDAMSFNYARLMTDRYLASEGKEVETTFLDHIQQVGLQWNPFRNRRIRRYIDRNVKTVFAVSHALKRALDVHGIPRVEVLPNGTDIGSWEASSEAIAAFKAKHDLNGKKVLFFGGRLSRDKGSTPLLTALRTIRETIPEVMLLVLGDKARLGGLIAEAKAEDLFATNIRCAGWLNQKEMAAAYGSVDVVTTPSLCLDTFNLINIEAMSAGKPVVGTIFGGTPEIVVDGITGFVRNPLKVEGYTEALLKLLKDDALAKRMGEVGRKRVEEHFSMERQTENVFRYYGN